MEENPRIPLEVKEAQARLDQDIGAAAVPVTTGGHGRVYRVGEHDVHVLFQRCVGEPRAVYVEVQGVHDALGHPRVGAWSDSGDVEHGIDYGSLADAVKRAAQAKAVLAVDVERNDACVAWRRLERAAQDVRARLPAALDGDAESRLSLATAVDEARQALQVLWSVTED